MSLYEDNATVMAVLENFWRNQLKNYLYIFIGGAGGGLLRVMATRAENIFTIGGMDLTILLVNIAGAFFLGVFLSGAPLFKSFTPGLNLGIAVGFFGSFTTFSTLCMEAAGLLKIGNLSAFIFYVGLSCIAGIGATELGFRTGAGTGFLGVEKTRSTISSARLHGKVVPVPIAETEDDD